MATGRLIPLFSLFHNVARTPRGPTVPSENGTSSIEVARTTARLFLLSTRCGQPHVLQVERMPHTRKRRGGRKYQLRKLQKIYSILPASGFGLLGVDPADLEHSFPSPPSPPAPRVEWRLHPVDLVVDYPWLPPLDILITDPRRERYTQIRAELLHRHYGGATPAHWPIQLE